MGQKVHPYGFRLGFNKTWRSRWYSDRDYAKLLHEDIAKVLQSAIANAQQKDGFGGDVDRLFVSACYANNGPSQKRVRPAPMGRAFRVVKRTTHLTVAVSERPVKVAPVAAAGGAPARKKAAPKAKASAPKARAGKKLDKE